MTGSAKTCQDAGILITKNSELHNISVIQGFLYVETIVFSPLSYEIISLGSVPFSCYDSLNEGPLLRLLHLNGINRRSAMEIFN